MKGQAAQEVRCPRIRESCSPAPETGGTGETGETGASAACVFAETPCLRRSETSGTRWSGLAHVHRHQLPPVKSF